MPAKRKDKPPAGRKEKTVGATPLKTARKRSSEPGSVQRSKAKPGPAATPPREGGDLYASLFRDSHTVMLIVDPKEGRIVDANRAAVRFYGYPARMLKTMRIGDINLLDERSLRAKMKQAAREEKRHFHFRHRLAGGAIRDVEVASGPILLGGRKLLYSIVRDITERRKSEEALRFEREQLFSLFDSMETLVYVADPSTHEILYVNKALQDMLGRPVVGHICYREFQGLESPCPFCTNEIILKQYPAPYYWEYYNPKIGRHFSIIDRIISWPDGRDVRVEFATDITERKRAEDRLRASLDLLGVAQHAANAGVWGWDMKTGKLTWSEEFYRLFGLDPAEEASFDAWLGVLHPDDRESAMAVINRAVEERKPLENEYRILRPGGQVRWISALGNTAYDEAGRPLSMYGICIDITERKRAEANLQESRNLLDATQRLARVGGWSWDVARQTMTWTDETYRIHGMTPGIPDPGSAELIARSLGCYDPEDRPVIEAAFRRCADEGVPYNLEFPLTTVDGRRIWIQTAAQPVIDGDRVVRVNGNIMDITGRRRAEEALRESEERFRAFMDNSPGIAWIKDEEGRHVYLSKAYETRFGVKLEDWRGKTDFDLWPPDTARTFRENDLAVLKDDRALEVTEEAGAQDGTRTYWWNVKFPIHDAAGRKYVAGFGVDITERRRAEEALRESESRYRLLVENAQFAVIVTSLATGLVLFANERACTLFSVPMNRAIGRQAQQHWVRPEDRDHFVESLTKTGKVTDYECALKTGTGAVIWVFVSATLIDFEGQQAAFIVYNDISERRRAEEALRDSLETASAMLNAATESFALLDTEGIVIAANETFARRLGTTLDAVIGTSAYGYLSGELAERRRERIREVIQNGYPLRFTDERAGRWLENSIYPIFDARGKVGRLVVYAQDITDRRRSEEALKQSEALLKSIFQAAPIGIGLVYNRVLGWVNDQVAFMLGYAVEELAERSARILYESDEEFERVGREKYVEVLQGSTGVIETHWRHKDGTMLDILLSSKAIDAQDLSTGVVFTALDISARKRSEEALQRYQDELERRVLERTSELMVANQALIMEIEDRNRADKALRDSERRLSDIISFLPDPTFVIDRDGRVIAWNRAMETMTGIAAKDMLGRGNYEYAVPFYGERRPLLIDMVLSGDESVAGRLARVKRRGDVLFGESYTPRRGVRTERVYLSGTAAPLYDSQGNLVGAIESIRDITERKRAEEELRYRDAILEVASFAAERFLKAPSWETDIREILARLGTVTGVSRVYVFENRTLEGGVLLTTQRYEWVAEGIEPQIDNLLLQGHEMEREGFARWAEVMRRGGHIFGAVREFPESERELLAAQGVLSIAAVPVYLGDRWWGFIGFDDCAEEREWSDVEMEALNVVASTLGAALSRRHTETRLTQTSERLSVVLESLPIVTFTSSGGEKEEITYITGTVEELTGFRPDEFLKNPSFFFDHVHPDDRPVVRSCHLGIGAKGMCGCEFRFRAENGSYRWFSEFCRLIRGPEGSIGHIVGIWQDVTEEKRILQESNTRLQQVIQAHKLASLGEIVAGVVHEINNPNSFIAYNIPLLEEIWKLCEPVLAEHAAANPGWGKRGVSYEQLRDDMAEIINAFRIGSDRITRVVSNLKDFARVEEGSQARPVSVNDVVEKTLMIVGGQIRRSVSRLDLDLGGGLPHVQGHFQKLEQVLANLLVNAHQSISDKEKGRIRISTRHLERLGAVIISIEDSGHGMTRSVLDRLFEPFFTTRRDTGGTGLGLSVSYGLIREHQGVIGVLSRPGIGSRFTVVLPLKPGAPLNLRPVILPLERDAERVEELQMQISGIDEGFLHWFYHCEPSVERLAEYLEQHPEVDVVLIPVQGEGLDAGRFLQTIRERHPLVTTIAWGGVEQEFTGPGGEKPDIHLKGAPDVRRLKEVLDGLTRQRF